MAATGLRRNNTAWARQGALELTMLWQLQLCAVQGTQLATCLVNATVPQPHRPHSQHLTFSNCNVNTLRTGDADLRF